MRVSKREIFHFWVNYPLKGGSDPGYQCEFSALATLLLLTREAVTLLNAPEVSL